MYEGFYGFRERPFTLLPDPDFLFLDDKHRTALEMLETAVSARSGFCVISGEIGAGKTTLIRELLNRLDETVCVGLVSNTHPSFGELLQWIMAAYGLPCDDRDEPELHKYFIEFVTRQYAQNKHTLLIIDEAQNLTLQALEELRLLLNVNSDRDLVLQVILVGQQQLRDRLQQPELEQFSQRIAFSYHLQALNPDETCRYIQHRVSHAGGEAGLFDTDACQLVYELSGGIPRLINRLCDLSLVYGCTAESKVITARLVARVAEDQRVGVLRDIPQVDPLAAKPEITDQLSDLSEQVDAEPESSAVPAAGKPPAQVVASPKQPEETGSTSSDTIVGAMSTVLMPELDAAVSVKKAAAETAAASELHQLVVNAEHKKRTGSERGALWLLLGIVVMAGGTGWLMRDFRNVEPVSVPGDLKEQAVSPATTQSPAVAEAISAAPVTAAGRSTRPEESLPERQDDQQLSVTGSKDPVIKDAGKHSEAEDISAQNAAKAKAQQRAAELRRESVQLERERRAAEQQLAKQRAARKEIERRARLEQKKMAAAKEAAKKLAEERTREERRLSEVAAAKSARQAPVQVGKAVASLPEVIDAYDEDDGDAIVLGAKASLADDAAEATVDTDSADGAVDLAVTSPTNEDDEDPVEFAANPCNGPTARFLSTCR